MSTIKLYKDCKILRGKNFVVDSLDDYLASFSPTIIDDFQFQKQALELSINISSEQANLEYLRANNFNYLESQNENGKKVYYFIKRKIWRAKSTMALELEMDVLNTLKYGIDYTLTDKTLIKRTHKNRFKLTNPHEYIISYNFTSDEDIIDLINEGYTIALQSNNGVTLPALTYGIYITCYDENNVTLDIDTLSLEINGEIVGSCCFLTLGRENNQLVFRGLNYEGTENFRAYIDFNSYFRIAPTQIEEEYEGKDYGLIDGEEYTAFSRYAYGYVRLLRDKYAIVDLQSEGITPQLYKNYSEVQTLKESKSNLDWYLIYRNRNEPSDSLINPVDVYICASEKIKVQFPANEPLTASDLTEGTYYYLIAEGNGAMTFSLSGASELTGEIVPMLGLRISKDGTNLKVEMLTCTGNINTIPFYMDLAQMGYSFNQLKVNGRAYMLRYSSNRNDNYADIINYPYTLRQDEAPTIEMVRSIEEIDRTSAKLIKIIKLPYAPFTVVEESEKLFCFDETQFAYDYNMGFIIVNTFNTKFKNEIKSNIENPLKVLSLGDFDAYLTDNKSMSKEVKLFHSDFYQPKFYYDSFNFTYNIEKVDLDSFINDEDKNFFKFTFNPTTTMNSRFLFTFSQYKTKYGSQDYDNIMIVTRNNEEVIYNVPYINYMRTGYNYDVKAKNRQELFTGLQTSLSVGGVAAALLTGNPLSYVAGAAVISVIASAIKSNLDAEDNIERKRQETLNQGASVIGSDDIDLLSVYAENKVKFAIYQPSEVMKKLLFDLFYYTGYIANYQGVPDITSRMWFNYLMCNPDYINLANISEEMLNKLTEKFNEGVTFLHKQVISSVNTWQFEQTKENWESNLF